MNIGDAWVAAGIVLVTAPLWVGLVSPYESVHGYDVRPVSADPESEHFVADHRPLFSDVTCGDSRELGWECEYVDYVLQAGEVPVNDFYAQRSADYAWFGEFYEWQTTDRGNGTVASLERVSPSAFLDDIAANPSPALERALESGRLPATFALDVEHTVYETSDGYRVVGSRDDEPGAKDRNRARTAAEWVGAGLGIASLIRGQRLRVEAER